jgi:hypothetical protein
MRISCAQQWTSSAAIDLTIEITYDGTTEDNASNVRPITFHIQPFITNNQLREGIRLYRLRLDGNWERSKCDDGFGTGFGIFDDPPIPVNIGDEADEYADCFVSLYPGESWTTQRRVQNGESWTSLPDDVEVGDKFKYVIKGAVVDWWNWGAKEQHRDTVVQLPCWIAGDVVEPKDNDGRPKLVVPKSNEVEFEFVG